MSIMYHLKVSLDDNGGDLETIVESISDAFVYKRTPLSLEMIMDRLNNYAALADVVRNVIDNSGELSKAHGGRVIQRDLFRELCKKHIETIPHTMSIDELQQARNEAADALADLFNSSELGPSAKVNYRRAKVAHLNALKENQ